MAAGWQAAPRELALGPDEVHVWRVPLAPPAAEVVALAHTLGDDERARAARFYFERDRTAFTVARGALRTLLGRYLGEPAGQLVFGYRDKGKPYLVAPAGALRFNVSHSGQVGLLAFVRGREVGVDVEQRRDISDLRALARTSFSPAEYAAFCALPPADHTTAFFACWSRKEAFIKATGEGISQLAGFDVSLAPGEPAALLRVAGEPPGRPRWLLQDLPAIPGYAAALVIEGRIEGRGHDLDVACWDGLPG
jgi:4'-phosphopantetheinyl transferase